VQKILQWRDVAEPLNEYLDEEDTAGYEPGAGQARHPIIRAGHVVSCRVMLTEPLPAIRARVAKADPFARLTENPSALPHRPLTNITSMVTSVGSKAIGLAGGWRSVGAEELKLIVARVFCGELPRDPMALLAVYIAVLAHRYMGFKDVARLWQSMRRTLYRVLARLVWSQKVQAGRHMHVCCSVCSGGAVAMGAARAYPGAGCPGKQRLYVPHGVPVGGEAACAWPCSHAMHPSQPRRLPQTSPRRSCFRSCRWSTAAYRCRVAAAVVSLCHIEPEWHFVVVLLC
jgi:hypothetical protein